MPIRVRLGSLPADADPVYEIILSLQLFKGVSFASGSRAADVLDTVYVGVRAPSGPVGPIAGHERMSIGGRTLDLQPDQVNALQLATVDQPVIAIHAAFGTGKTVIGALLAARIFRSQQSTVVATTTTNTAVAQFTDTLLRLDDHRDLDIVRYVCDSALLEGSPTTPVDIHNVLKRLADDYGHRMSEQAVKICRRYKRGRELLETYLFEPDRALHLTEQQREENKMAEREVSDITSDVIRIMFEVRPPAVVCLTTSALLNAVTSGGIFSDFLADVKTVIADEASQISEPAMVAIATRLPQARHIYIGDIHQLEPHVRCSRSSNPARFGARGVMELLLEKGIPSAPLTTTFRCHPDQLELSNQLCYHWTLRSGTQPAERQMFLNAVRCLP